MNDQNSNLGALVQAQIYAGGLSGVLPDIPTGFPELENAARHKMSARAWAYVAGGAGIESTMSANRAAFDRLRISPRMLGGAGARDLSCTLFGKDMSAPLLTAPIGVLDLAHPLADLAVARAAARLGLPMIMSSQASIPMEEIAIANGAGVRWFQLYWGRSDDLARSFVRRAEACGASAIVLTLDTTILGWRPRDLDGAHLPFLRAEGIAQYTSDPVFRAMLARPPEDDPGAAALLFTQIFSDPSLDWARIAQIRSWTSLPVILKGVLRADDARRALEAGFAGIIVSNHGGRQVDGAVAALDALAPVVEAVGAAMPVLFDSGVRCGADIFKAIARGAAAVCVGRPYVYGLALHGEAGVEAVLKYLMAELDITMALCGAGKVCEITVDGVLDVHVKGM